MNALVASVIRTLVPHIVTQIASLFLMLNINVPNDIRLQLSAVVGFVLFVIYYVVVRVLEQQWPGIGVLLGLPSSPDTYSKGNLLQNIASALAPAASNSDAKSADTFVVKLPETPPASKFPAAAVAAAQASAESAPIDVKVELPEPAPAPAAPEVPVPTV